MPDLTTVLTELKNRKIGDLADLSWLFKPYIDGTEITQAIQYYHADQHREPPATWGPDNSMRLVANKPAWVRVYVGALLFDHPNVTARITYGRRSHFWLWQTVGTLTPLAPGRVTARHALDYATQRGNSFFTLNFVIPANEFYGSLRLRIELLDSAGTVQGTETVYCRANLRQTLRVRAIPIAYNGPARTVAAGAPAPANISIAAPTVADLRATCARSLLAMPVQSTGWFSLTGSLNWNRPLDDPRLGAGLCSTNWNALLGALAVQQTNDGNRTDVVYYGLLPATMPINVPGCGSPSIGSGLVGDQGTLLHEIGHGYGFQHTPCGAAGATDPNYPNYAPYPSASIGEYGLDISNGVVFSPQSTLDYMSYCFPQWISLYQHGRLIMHPRLAPEILNDSSIFDQYAEQVDYDIQRDLPYPSPVMKLDPERFMPVISVIGEVGLNREIKVFSVARVPVMTTSTGRPTRLSLRLLDEQRSILAEGRVQALVTHGCGCEGQGMDGDEVPTPPYVFQAFLSDVTAGQALELVDGDMVLWERHAPEKKPHIKGLKVSLTRTEELQLAWQVSRDAEDTEVWVQWAEDADGPWQGLVTGLRGQEAKVSIAALPAGEVFIRALAHDGFYTAVSKPVSVKVPEGPLQAAMLSPTPNQVFVAHGPMRVWGSVTDRSGQVQERAECRWFLDGVEVASECDQWITAPAAGKHEITMEVRSRGTSLKVVQPFITVNAGVEPAEQSRQADD